MTETPTTPQDPSIGQLSQRPGHSPTAQLTLTANFTACQFIHLLGALLPRVEPGEETDPPFVGDLYCFDMVQSPGRAVLMYETIRDNLLKSGLRLCDILTENLTHTDATGVIRPVDNSWGNKCQFVLAKKLDEPKASKP